MSKWAAAGLITIVVSRAFAGQTLEDDRLMVQTYARGFSSPSSAVFLNSSGDALIAQRNDGKVLLVRNRQIVGTALDLAIPSPAQGTSGLSAIALSPGFETNRRVYVAWTGSAADGGFPTTQQVARFKFDPVQGKLKFDQFVWRGPDYNALNRPLGGLAFDAKGKLYLSTGNQGTQPSVTQNYNPYAGTITIPATPLPPSELVPFGTGTISIPWQTREPTASILRLQPDGTSIATNPFGADPDFKDVFSYGVRDAKGLAVDPVSGVLWDAEQSGRFDEVNRVSGGSNGGWARVSGPAARNSTAAVNGLISIGAKAAYSDPQFSWNSPARVGDLHFLHSSRLGMEYADDLFVANGNGTIFHFDLTQDRTSLVLAGGLADRVADNTYTDLLFEQESILFGQGFGSVSDLLAGPGGMFVLSEQYGTLYRIRDNPNPGLSVPISVSAILLPEPGMLFGTWALTCWLTRPRRRRGQSSFSTSTIRHGGSASMNSLP